jgi:Zn-dependent protease with chaperone function
MAFIPLTRSELQTIFRTPIAPTTITHGYRLRLVGVLVGLVLLQFLYLLLIAAVGYLTWLYAIVAASFKVPLNVITIVIYVGPPIVGVIATLFVIKPLVIRPRRQAKLLQLLPENEPVLFEFIYGLCRAIGSPRPAHIYVDLRVNASASIRGWLGFFFGHVDLTIGLPLAAGLSLQQFTGVLAHEFGHFTQKTGLRSYFLIQTIQNWFARVVHQRDRLDYWLDRQCKRRDWRIKGVAQMADFVVRASRKYLGLLMRAGNWISSGFSRQMEFDADLREVATVGVDAFEQTLQQLPLLESGTAIAWEDASRDWTVGRLPGDMPALIVTRSAWLTPQVKEQILGHALARKTGTLDTHPCPSDRIVNVRTTAQRYGALALEGPTERIFTNLAAVCREATVHHYKTVFGLEGSIPLLVPADEAIADAQADREYENAALHLFRATPQFCSRWFRLEATEPREIEEAKDLGGAQPEFDADSYDSAVRTSLLHFAALILAQAGTKVNPSSFQVPAADLSTIRREETASGRYLTEMLDQYRQTANGIAKRIESTVARLLSGEFGLAIPADRNLSLPDLRAAWSSYSVLSQLQDEIMEVRCHNFALQIVRENARLIHAGACANLIDELETLALSRIEQAVARTREIPAAITFDPALASTVGAQITPNDSLRTDQIRSFLSRVDMMSTRALSELAWFTLTACPLTEDQAQAEPSGTVGDLTKGSAEAAEPIL